MGPSSRLAVCIDAAKHTVTFSRPTRPWHKDHWELLPKGGSAQLPFCHPFLAHSPKCPTASLTPQPAFPPPFSPQKEHDNPLTMIKNRVARKKKNSPRFVAGHVAIATPGLAGNGCPRYPFVEGIATLFNHIAYITSTPAYCRSPRGPGSYWRYFVGPHSPPPFLARVAIQPSRRKARPIPSAQ